MGRNQVTTDEEASMEALWRILRAASKINLERTRMLDEETRDCFAWLQGELESIWLVLHNDWDEYQREAEDLIWWAKTMQEEASK